MSSVSFKLCFSEQQGKAVCSSGVGRIHLLAFNACDVLND